MTAFLALLYSASVYDLLDELLDEQPIHPLLHHTNEVRIPVKSRIAVSFLKPFRLPVGFL